MTVDLVLAARAISDRLVEQISGARFALITTHENPDADTLGAGLGLARIIEAIGGRATVTCSDPVPPLYAFLPGIDRVALEPERGAAYDLVVVLDCGSLDRIGAIQHRHHELFARLPTVVIDHHASSEPSGPADWIDPTSAATCEMVALLAVRLGVPLTSADRALATVLMAGIVMDTATFAHPNTTPRTLAVTAELLAAGAPLSEVSRRLYRTKPEAQLRLFGRVLERLESADAGRIVWSSLLEADLRETGSPPSYSEGIIDVLSQAERAEVTVLFKEEGSATRISVRTRPGGVDATALTGAFGGGGHVRAAGATIALPLSEAREAVIAEARRQLAAPAR